MAKKYLDYDGLLYFWQKIKNTFALASAVPTKTSTTPKMDGTAAIGNETKWAAGNHVHPTDTSRAPLASPTFTGTPKAPTATTGTATTQIATCEFVANTVGAMTSGVSDVQIDSTSVVSSGIATIPKSSSSQFGVVKVTHSATTNSWKSSFETGDNSFSVPTLDGEYKLEDTVLPIAGQTQFGVAKMYSPSPGILSITTSSEHKVPRLDANNLIPANMLPDASSSVKGAMSAADKNKLDSITMTNGIIDSSVLPSFVDDVIEAYARSNQTELSSTWLATGSASGTVITPETGKIYVLMNDSTSYAANSQFRWGGTAYVKLSDGGVSEITNAEIDVIVAS